MAATETIRIRIEPDIKEALTQLYRTRGTTVSQAVRSFLTEELHKQQSIEDRFDAIMASADRKLESSGEEEPSIEGIISYVDRLRTARHAATDIAS